MRPPSAQLLLAADEKSRENDWIAAADLYHQALDHMDQTQGPSEHAEVADLAARSYYTAAFQSQSRREFVRRAHLAEDLLAQEAALYEEAGAIALSKRAKSRSLFAAFWQEEDSEKRRNIVQQCFSFSKAAAQLLDGLGEVTQLGETYKEILSYCREIIHLAKDGPLLKTGLEEILETGRKAVTHFRSIGHNGDFVEAVHPVLWAIAVAAEIILEPSEFSQLHQEATRLGQQILDASLRVATARARCLGEEATADVAWDLEGDLAKATSRYKAATNFAREMNDQFATGRLLAVLATLQRWIAMTGEYSEERELAAREGLNLAEEAINHLGIPFHTSYLARAHKISAGCYISLAESVETDPERKRKQLESAIEVSRRGMSYEGQTMEWYGCAHELSRALYFLAIATNSRDEKVRLLGESLPVREETVRVVDSQQPHSWNRGVNRNYLALIEAELARLETNPEVKVRLLREAVSHMKDCLNLCEKWSTTVPRSAQRLARYSEWYGDILYELSRETHETEVAEKAAKAYLEAIDYLAADGQSSPRPTIRWKIAKLHDSFGNFRQASQNFSNAAEEYRVAASKIPGTDPAFNELATYMDAWAEIEKGRLHHAEEQYRLAQKDYAEAALRFRATKPWSFLSSICAARSMLEKAEEQSNAERHMAAVRSLVSALSGCREAKSQLDFRLVKSEGSSDEEELRSWLRHVSQRETYCLGKIELEKAKAMDRKGQKTGSSRKYESASRIFIELAAESSNPSDREEIGTLAQFCDSWSKMKMAESRSSPELFGQAAEAFMKAGQECSRQTPRLLALANASICRALSSGTLFRLTRNPELYSEIKRQLETASDYFMEAEFKKTATWTRATQRLFDALVYSGDAGSERDPRKKAELLQVAQDYFRQAAELYGEAGFPRKKIEAAELEKGTLKEKKALLETLRALGEIPTASTSGIGSIPRTGAEPPGLRRFEEAHVSGIMRSPPGETTVGSEFNVVFDIVNLGKTAATLVKLQNVIPEGLEPVVRKGQPNLQDNAVDLRGKRLQNAESFEVKISLRASREGTFDLRPGVAYADERGNYGFYEFRPTVIIVREHDLREGQRAPPVSLPQDMHFENERAGGVFRHLVQEFLSEYMSKRIVMEKAGWRSLMKIIRDMEIPRSTLYGPGGRAGPVLSELDRRGLIETRIFPKEPGRGGDITKVRIAFDNVVVREIVNDAVKSGS